MTDTRIPSKPTLRRGAAPLAPALRPAAAHPVPDTRPSHHACVLGKKVVVNGHVFSVELDMAAIFLRQVQEAVLAGDNSLVVLRHVNGIEMIPIGRHTPVEVLDILCPAGTDPDEIRSRYGLRVG